MGVKVKVRLPEVDIEKTKAKIHKVMTDHVIESLKTWVIHTTDPIPVYTGAARASFLKLARQAGTSISITPTAPSRIPLGVASSTGEVFAEPGKSYGWNWSSNLDHISIVDDNVQFVDAGLRALKSVRKPTLPQPVYKTKK